MVYYEVKNCSESRQRFSATSQIMVDLLGGKLLQLYPNRLQYEYVALLINHLLNFRTVITSCF